MKKFLRAILSGEEVQQNNRQEIVIYPSQGKEIGINSASPYNAIEGAALLAAKCEADGIDLDLTMKKGGFELSVKYKPVKHLDR